MISSWPLIVHVFGPRAAHLCSCDSADVLWVPIHKHPIILLLSPCVSHVPTSRHMFRSRRTKLEHPQCDREAIDLILCRPRRARRGAFSRHTSQPTRLSGVLSPCRVEPERKSIEKRLPFVGRAAGRSGDTPPRSRRNCNIRSVQSRNSNLLWSCVCGAHTQTDEARV